MDTDSFINHIKTENVYEGIADDVKKDLIHQITQSIYHFQQEKNVIGFMKDELGGKITTEFIALRPKIMLLLSG